MMHMRVAFFSEALGFSTSMTVLLPQRQTEGQIGLDGATSQGLPPVLYLLHGASDDDTIWTRRTSIERYASQAGLAVVMPSACLSFYSNERQGFRYWDHIAEELPQLVADSFQVSTRPEDTYVAGLSMGGFGAMKLALQRPDRFAAAASMSGALNPAGWKPTDVPNPFVERVWGDGDLNGTDADLINQLGQANKSTLPRLWVGCGQEDFLWDDHQSFVAAAERAGIEVTQSITPGGHTWDLWDREIEKIIDWFGIGTD